MKLTPKEIKTIDEILLDKLTTNKTLDIALQYHSNTMNKLEVKEREFWEYIRDKHGLDDSKKYKITNAGGGPAIVEAD